MNNEPNAPNAPESTAGADHVPEARLLTIMQAAELLQVGRCTMQELVVSGRVASLKIGRLRRVPPEAIDEFIGRQLATEGGAA